MEHLETAEFRVRNLTIIFCVFSGHKAFVLHFSFSNFGVILLLHTTLYIIHHICIYTTHIIHHIIERKALSL